MRKLVTDRVSALAPYVPGEQWRESGVVKLNTNENPYPPSPRVLEALHSFSVESLRLYPDPSARRLRERIAEIHGCSVANVFAGNGSDEILSLCTKAFAGDDGTVGFFDPSYSLYAVLAEIRGVAARPVELAADFGWRMPAGYGCSLFFLANPNAPTGILYPRQAVADFCERARGVVVLDEAYVDFAGEDCMDLALGMENVLVARTLSKSYSLAGLRVGYAVGSPLLIGALMKLKDSYNTDALSQELAFAALSDTAYMRRNVERIKATRERLARELDGRGAVVFPSRANFLWVRPGGVTAAAFYEGLRSRRILVRYFDGPRTRECVRITVGADEQVDALLKAVGDLERA